jgi:hypothetical protein
VSAAEHEARGAWHGRWRLMQGTHGGVDVEAAAVVAGATGAEPTFGEGVDEGGVLAVASVADGVANVVDVGREVVGMSEVVAKVEDEEGASEVKAFVVGDASREDEDGSGSKVVEGEGVPFNSVR